MNRKQTTRKQTSRRHAKAVKGRESLIVFKKELKSLTFEPTYGGSMKEIATRFTTIIQQLADRYGYDVEFPERAQTEIDGETYYFVYLVKVKTKGGARNMYIEAQYFLYEGSWMGMITNVR